jgi:hypothetical protein
MRRYTEEELAGLRDYLSENGCSLPPRVRMAPKGLSIKEIPEGILPQIFSMHDGRTGFVMNMSVVNEGKRPIRISRIQVATPWGLSSISLLPNPSKVTPGYECYIFPGHVLDLHRSMVINDILSVGKALNPDVAASGLLVGIDEQALPDNLPEYAWAVVTLEIFDSWGNRFGARFKLRVDRSNATAQKQTDGLAELKEAKAA